jgi:hypothetical protein
MGTGDGPVGSNSGRIGEIAPSRSRGAFQQDNMSAVGEIEAKTGVLGEDKAGGTPERITTSLEANQVDWQAKTTEFKARIASYQKDRQTQLEGFWNKYVKAAKKGDKISEPDPETLNNDIERLLYNRKKDPKLPQLDKISNHEELHKEVANLRTKHEEIRYTQNQRKSLVTMGTTLLDKDGEYATYRVTTPEALSWFANQGSSWCTRSNDTAASMLEDYDYKIVTKNDKPLFALKYTRPLERAMFAGTSQDQDLEVFHVANRDLINGTDYVEAQGEVAISSKDQQYVNKILKQDQKPLVTNKYVAINDNEAQHQVFNPTRWKEKDLDLRKTIFGSEDNDEVKTQINAPREKHNPQDWERIDINSPEQVIAYAGAYGGLPEEHREALEKKLAENAIDAVNYARATGKRFEAAEPIIAQNAREATMYAAEVIKGRFEAGEAKIAKNPGMAVAYTRLALGGKRFKQAEANIVNNARASVGYASAIGKRFVEGEHTIAKDAIESYRYSTLLGERFEAGEGAIFIKGLKDYQNTLKAQQQGDSEDDGSSNIALRYFKHIQRKVNQDFYSKIAKSSILCQMYAQSLGFSKNSPSEHDISGIFTGGNKQSKVIADAATGKEPQYIPLIAKDAKLSLLYTKETGGKRFPEGEAAMKNDPVIAILYAKITGQRFEAAEAIIAATGNISLINKYKEITGVNLMPAEER